MSDEENGCLDEVVIFAKKQNYENTDHQRTEFEPAWHT